MLFITYLFDYVDLFCFNVYERSLQKRSEIKIMNTVEQLKKAFEEFLAENEKFVEKGNKAAAGRARKALMEIAKLAKVRRAEILEEKK